MQFVPKESAKPIRSYRKESSFYKELALIDLDKGQSVVEVRFYGAGTVAYCVVWVHGWEHGFPAAGVTGSCRGVGKAGGYGYHKASAAMQEALQDAGFTLSEPIDGRGDSAMDSALEDIAKLFAIARPYIHRAHA